MRRGFIYFAEILSMGAIKIGWSTNPMNRLRYFLTSFGRARLIGVIPQRSMQFETSLHKRLSAFRLTPIRNREIYADSVELRSFISRMNPIQATEEKTPIGATNLTLADSDRLDAAVARRRAAKPGTLASRASVLREWALEGMAKEEAEKKSRRAS